MSSARIAALRAELRSRFPTAQPVEDAPQGALPTGVPALDRLLPHSGLPRGRVSEWVAALSGGSATLLRSLVRETLGRDGAGSPVGLVDAGRTLAAQDWLEMAQAGNGRGGRGGRGGHGLTLVRPLDPRDGPWCAEILLRTGAFGLVVLDGVAVSARAAPRLAHRVREAGCAFLMVRPEPRIEAGSGGENGHSGAAIRLSLSPAPVNEPGDRHSARAGDRHSARAGDRHSARAVDRHSARAGAPASARRGARSPEIAPANDPWSPDMRPIAADSVRRITATLVKGGPHEQVELSCVLPPSYRLCAHPLVPDRRGGARRGRSW
jgi:hypothetical protein